MQERRLAAIMPTHPSLSEGGFTDIVSTSINYTSNFLTLKLIMI